MRLPRCTIDSSCVIALDHLGLLPGLSLLFERVLVPKGVREELLKRRVTKDRLRVIFETYAFIERCDDYEQGAVAFLLAERKRQRKRDRGEVEAVVQAVQFGSTVIVDDRWGRALAIRDDLETHGTFWVLKRFYELQFISSSKLRQYFVALRARATRLPWKDVDKLLREIGELPLR